MKRIGSGITTLPEGPPSRTGTQHGERGLATLESSKVAEWLARQAPSDVDQAAVLRASSHGVGLRVRYEGRYPPGGGWYEVAVGCDIDGTEERRETALADLMKFQTPADVRSVEGWLAELSVICAKRQDDEFSEALRIEAYASRLRQYPADVARSAVLGKSWKFWPTWAELESECEKLAAPRRTMIAALRRPPVVEPERRPASAEERARIQRLVDEQFPEISSEWRQRAVDDATKGDCMKRGQDE